MNKNIINYSEKFIHYYSNYIPKKIKELLDNNNFSKIADIGCGDGSLLYSLKVNGYFENFDKIYALDISQKRLERVKDIDKRIIVICDDILELKNINKFEKVDFIVSNQLIEHVPDDEKTIENISRFLSDNGICYISTVYKKWYGWYFYKNKYGKWVIDPTHEREYKNDNELIPIFKKYNLEILWNKKILFKFPVLDFFLKRMGLKQDIYEKNKILKFLRNIKIPIFGYYYWELVAKKIVKGN